MIIIINNVQYSSIKNLKFAADTDIIGGELPINDFSADIKTTDNITIGQYAYLKDENAVTWAKFWIVSAERYSDKYVSIYCQSDIMKLERSLAPAVMYAATAAGEIIEDLFDNYGLNVDIDNSLENIVVSGFCPEQTARERLQWICFVIGAYVQSTFVETVKILPVSASVTPIYSDNVYYRPSIQYGDYVTKIRLTVYSYTQGSPTPTDEWVTPDKWNFYIQTTTQIEVSNPNVPAYTPENVIEISDITLVNTNNAADILSRVSSYYFNRTEVTADVINNGEYKAGNKYMIDMDNGQLLIGYARECDFSFGNSHKSTMLLKQAEIESGVELDIMYKHNTEVILTKVYYLPSGFVYSIENKYIDRKYISNGVPKRTVYRPVNSTASGTMGNDTTVNNQAVEIALDREHNMLSIISVDGVSISGDEVSIT